jgi:ketosteroid isomerase-like protein
MSEANLEIARRMHAAIKRRDWDDLDMLADDLVYHPIAEIADAGEYHGRQGFRGYVESFVTSGWVDDLTYEASFQEYGDSVIVRIQFSGQGRASGLDFRARVFEVLSFGDGKIVRIEDFTDRDEAIAAATA